MSLTTTEETELMEIQKAECAGFANVLTGWELIQYIKLVFFISYYQNVVKMLNSAN